MDEFTFPTIAAAEQDSLFPHFATSPLWFPSSAAAESSPAQMEASKRGQPEAAEDGTVADEKMDLLWENFNEELHRAGSRSKAADTGSELSDTESEMVRHGCTPVLRASSRAGGASHYRRTSWVLLMRIFRKLFVIEKTITSGRQL